LFLGKIAAKQNLSAIVVKLARLTGDKAKEETTVATGVVTRGGKRIVRLDDLPPGRIGLKAGHDASIDPHVPRWESREKIDITQFQKLAEPWQGAVVVSVAPGKTTTGVTVDFRPPAPLVDPAPPAKPKK
jgi:hypothetical protein